MIEQMKHDGPVQVVDAGLLATLTASGWVLLAVVYEDDMRGGSGTYVPMPAQGSYQPPPAYNIDMHVVRCARYLVGQTKDVALKAAAERASKAEHDLDIARSNEKTATKLGDEARALAKKETERADANLLRTRECADGRARIEERLRKMETDLAKARAAVGEIKWKEIVA